MNYAQREADWWVRHSEKLKKEVKKLRKQLSEAEDVIQCALDMTSDDDAKSVFEDFLGGGV
tara:strand:- start:256 stop:438 length:183 start_codon:yes stop_codon:yes gene_type:complete